MGAENWINLVSREPEGGDSADFFKSMIAHGANANDVFKCKCSWFHATYAMIDAKNFPEEAYEEYRDLEDLFEICSSPAKANTIRMNELRRTMQTYAEANR